MALTLRRGTVSAIVERHEGLVRLEVDGRPCVAYPELTGPVALGDDVLVNVQARELGLGSGGFDVLHANLTRGLELSVERDAHVMKLRTRRCSTRSCTAEQSALPGFLEGMPVVACSLHSQLAPVCAALRGLRVTYVQLPGGALPMGLSDAVRALKGELVQETFSVGACFGGDVECVSAYSALALAHARGADVVVCAIGPGIVGTGSARGHGGMAAADAIGATLALGGRVLALRISEGDPRDRHRGVSHHSRAVLELSLGDYDVAWPAGCPFDDPAAARATAVDVEGWRGVRRPAAVAHGTRSRRRPVVLRSGVRGRPSRSEPPP